MNDDVNSGFRTSRGYQIVNQQEGELTSAMEDYLEMIYRVCSENNYTRVGKLSEMLHVKPSSASKMIFKLADMGYIKYDRYEIILLTEKGKKNGAYLLRRHNVIEEFLQTIQSDKVLEETELIEHSLGLATVTNLSAFMEFMKKNDLINKWFSEIKK